MDAWFFAKAGQSQGPVTLDELRARIQAGDLAPADLVWAPGMSAWQPAAFVSRLRRDPATLPPATLPATATSRLPPLPTPAPLVPPERAGFPAFAPPDPSAAPASVAPPVPVPPALPTSVAPTAAFPLPTTGQPRPPAGGSSQAVALGHGQGSLGSSAASTAGDGAARSPTSVLLGVDRKQLARRGFSRTGRLISVAGLAILASLLAIGGALYWLKHEQVEATRVKVIDALNDVQYYRKSLESIGVIKVPPGSPALDTTPPVPAAGPATDQGPAPYQCPLERLDAGKQSPKLVGGFNRQTIEAQPADPDKHWAYFYTCVYRHPERGELTHTVLTFEKYHGDREAADYLSKAVTQLESDALHQLHDEDVISPDGVKLGHIYVLYGANNSTAAMVWTNGRHFLQVRALTVEAALEFKRELPY